MLWCIAMVEDNVLLISTRLPLPERCVYASECTCVCVCESSFVLPSSSRWFRNSVLDFRSQERTTVLLSLRSVVMNQRSLMTGQYSLRCLENSKCKFVHEYSGEGKTLLNTNSKIWNCLCLTMTVLCYILYCTWCYVLVV